MVGYNRNKVTMIETTTFHFRVFLKYFKHIAGKTHKMQNAIIIPRGARAVSNILKSSTE